MAKVLYIVFISLIVFSCKMDEEEPAVSRMPGIREFEIRVKENKIPCSGYEGQTQCYLVQLGSAIGSNNWEYFYEKIEGFDYEEGYVYKLMVRKENIENAPADAPSARYILVEVISKEAVN